MKTIIKLLIALAVLNAAVKGGSVAWSYFLFRDATQELVTFSSQTSTTDLHSQIMARAAELKVPIASEDVVVHRGGIRTAVQARYRQPVELFPSYVYNASFSFEVDSLAAIGTPPAEPQQ